MFLIEKSSIFKMTFKFPTKFNNWDVTIALRYLPVVSFLKREGTKKDILLEIGSGSLGICPYLKRQITGVDIVFAPKTHPLLKPVRSSAENLPFKDKTFDFVLSVDVLEHLSVKQRKKAIKEMVRVAQKGIVIGIPSGWGARLTDRYLDWYYSKTHQEKSTFLTEHLKYGLPEKKEFELWLREEISAWGEKATIKIRQNTNIFLLIFLLSLGFSQNKVLCRFYRYMLFLIPILRLINFPPAYRTIFFVRIEKSETK